MSKTLKNYRLTERCIKQLEQIAEHHALPSATATIEWLANKEHKATKENMMQTQKWIYGVERETFYQIPKGREAMETHLEFGDALPTRDELLYSIGCQESMSGEPIDRDAALAALEIAKA